MNRALDIVGTGPDEGPDSARLAHYNVMNLSAGKVFVRCASHLEILTEKHHLEGSVRTVSNFNHLEAKVLPNRLYDKLDGGHG